MFVNRLSHRWIQPEAAAVIALLLAASASFAQEKLPVRWEDLTGPDFIQAIGKARNTCVLPMGVLEKHGPQLPIGTDLIDIRYVAIHASEQEYALVFPAYYFSQINEARTQPGTIAYSPRLEMELLQETADEMARNGCKKIVIANGHGGNPNLLRFFAQSQMAKPRDYAVYVFFGTRGHPSDAPAVTDTINEHAGQSETSEVMASRPDLVHMDRCGQESGARQSRDPLPKTLFTAMAWWYADFPNHYAGNGCLATKALGEGIVKNLITQLAQAISAVKSDDNTLRLQNEFYKRSAEPLDTPQTGTWWVK